MHIIIQLIDAIKHISSYLNFLKNLCTQYRCSKTITLSENVSATIKNYMLKKCKDPRPSYIFYKIWGMPFEKALLDLGTSVSILSAATYEEFNLGELKSTSVIL